MRSPAEQAERERLRKEFRDKRRGIFHMCEAHGYHEQPWCSACEWAQLPTRYECAECKKRPTIQCYRHGGPFKWLK